MARFGLIAAGCVLATCACGEEAEAAARAIQEPAPPVVEAAPIVAPTPAPPPSTPYERALAARAMPASPPTGLFQHYRLDGRARFTQEDRKPVEQDCAAGLGGPAQLSYELFTETGANVFLLESAEAAWVMSGAQREYRAYETSTLARETWIRWTLLRFPWDWSAAFEAGPRAEDGRFALEGPAGTVSVELDPDGRPLRLFHPLVTVELDDWRPLADGRLAPHTWTWTQEWGEMHESFASIEGGALFLDRNFAPPGRVRIRQGWKQNLFLDPERPEGTQREIGLVERPALAYLAADNVDAWQGVVPEVDPRLAPHWLRIPLDGASRFVRPLEGAAPSELPAGVSLHEEPAGVFLRWVEFGAMDPAAAVAELRQAARVNGLEERGPAWARLVPQDEKLHQQEFLLPVHPPKR